MAYEFEGVQYGKLRDMQEARRARYVQLLEEGLNFTQAAHAVGVSKRTGKVWRNGRTRSNGRNERPLVDWYGGRVKDSTITVSSRYLSIDERIEIADLSRSGTSVRGIARRLGRSASTVSRELRRNAHPADGRVPTAPRRSAGGIAQAPSQAAQDQARNRPVRTCGRRAQAALEPRADQQPPRTRVPR